MKKVLITGGTGFVGHHLIEHVLKNTDWDIVILDRIDTASNPNRILGIDGIDALKHRIKFLWWDLKSELNSLICNQLGGPFDYIFHLAAGSHVERSIEDPMSFFQDNCIGTVNILQYAKHWLKSDGRFLYFSTDEVFGPAPMDESFTGYKEWDRLNPNNPYAAAKAAAEMAVISFSHTYRIPCVMTNTMNIYGERQHPEKYVPLVINKVLKGEKLFIHANKDCTQAGKRHYLHARNISAATLWVAQNGELLNGSAKQGRYNIVGEIEMDNLELAKLIERYVHEWQIDGWNPPGDQGPINDLNYELVDFHSSRPGHDLRYALDGTHLAEAGFSYPVSFHDSLRKTVWWTLDHRSEWL
jgi:dTDP-glucose 4,6-dehydratase